MSGFYFRLQQLLDQRVLVKEEAVRNMAARREELRKEEAALAQIQGHIKNMTQQIRSTRQAALGSRHVGVQALIRLSDYLRGLSDDAGNARHALFAQEVAVDDAKARLDQALAHLAVSQRQEEILTKFRDRLHHRFVKTESRKAEAELDEAGTIQYLVMTSIR